MEGFVSIPISIGILTILTIVLNILQLWCLHKQFRRHLNPLMVIIFHLSVADLLEGIAVILSNIIYMLKEKIFLGSSQFFESYDILVQANRFLLSVSIVTLATLTVLKMLRITRNECLTKLTIKRISRAIWIVMFVIFFTEYVVYKAHGYSDDVKLVTKFRRLWLPVLTLLAAIIIVYCFTRMFYVMRMRQVQTSQEPVGRRKRCYSAFGRFYRLYGSLRCTRYLGRDDRDRFCEIRTITSVLRFSSYNESARRFYWIPYCV